MVVHSGTRPLHYLDLEIDFSKKGLTELRLIYAGILLRILSFPNIGPYTFSLKFFPFVFMLSRAGRL